LQANKHPKLVSMKCAPPTDTQINQLCYPYMSVSMKRKDSRWFDQSNGQRTKLIDQRLYWPFG